MVNVVKVIGASVAPSTSNSVINPPKRGKGRPPGTLNKPKKKEWMLKSK